MLAVQRVDIHESSLISSYMDLGSVRREIGELFSRRGSYELPETDAYWIRGAFIKDRQILEVLNSNIGDLVETLRKFKRPNEFCRFKHEVRSFIGEKLLTPDTCFDKRYNPSCGHPEQNNIALLLVVGYILLGRNLSDIDDYIYGLMNADTTASKELKRSEGVDNSIFEEAQNLYGGLGERLCSQLANDLENKFVNS